MPTHWRRLGLRPKTILLLATGLLLVFASFSYLMGHDLARTTDAALQEKLAEAGVVARSTQTYSSATRRSSSPTWSQWKLAVATVV